MSSARGVVSRLWEKEFSGKILHSFSLQGDKTYYGTGERKVVEQGKSYEFQTKTTPTGRVNVDLGTLRPWSAPEGAIQAAPVASYPSAAGTNSYAGGRRPFVKDESKDTYWKDKETRDIRNDGLRELGATRNTALSLMSVMLTNGAVKLPVKENAREKALYELFEHYTEILMKGREKDEDESEPTASVAETETPVSQESEWK